MISYRITPKQKKSIIDVEIWRNKDGNECEVTNVWRYGEYHIMPKDNEEKVLLLDMVAQPQEGYVDDSFEVTKFEHWELDHVWDSCECSITTGFLAEDEEEEFVKKWEEDGECFLNEEGFEPNGCDIYIHNGVEIEKCFNGD